MISALSPASENDGWQATNSLRRLVIARWWALATILSAVLAIPHLVDLPLPRWPMLAVIAVVGAWNVIVQQQVRGARPLGAIDVFGQIALDLIAFAALLFFSGGATNPLVFMLLLPVVLAALILPRRYVIIVSSIAIALYSLLMLVFIPLPLADPARGAMLHLAGMWITFVVSVAMLSWFVLRTTATLRTRDAELAAAREQTLRDERVLALGALAAGAAHELGTPLATLAVLTGELQRTFGSDARARDDLQLMRDQISYCKRIITALTERAGDRRSENAEPVRCDTWIQGLYEVWHALRARPDSTLTIAEASEEAPVIVVEPTLGQGMLSLLDNALRAGTPVRVSMNWTPERLEVEIRDHGPGYSAAVIAQAGTVPFPPSEHGSGIGLLLTRAAIERLGGNLQLSNAIDGGAIARLTLPFEKVGTRHVR